MINKFSCQMLFGQRFTSGNSFQCNWKISPDRKPKLNPTQGITPRKTSGRECVTPTINKPKNKIVHVGTKSNYIPQNIIYTEITTIPLATPHFPTVVEVKVVISWHIWNKTQVLAFQKQLCSLEVSSSFQTAELFDWYNLCLHLHCSRNLFLLKTHPSLSYRLKWYQHLQESCNFPQVCFSCICCVEC